MWLPVTALALGAPLVLAVADRVPSQVPTLNIEPSCRAVADSSNPIRRNYDSCIKSEQQARADTEKEWSQFSAAAKSHCVALSTTGGVPSYTELITCLEMERQDAELKRNGAASTTGSGTGATMTPAHGQSRRY